MHSPLTIKHPSARSLHTTDNLITKTASTFAAHCDCNMRARDAFHRLVHCVRTRTDLLNPGLLNGPKGFRRVQSVMRVCVNLSLASRRWVRPPEDISLQVITSGGATPNRQMRRLIDHLFCTMAVPTFAYRVWMSEPTGVVHDDQRLFLHLAVGHSIRGTVKGRDLTKTMAKRFLRAPSSCTIDQAIQFARTGSRPSVPRTYPFGTTRYRRKQVAIRRPWRVISWLPLPIEGFELLDDCVHPYFGRRMWTIRQLTTRGALDHESSRMRHCVGQYWGLCVRGFASIWTMERRDRLRTRAILTIEIDAESHSIVQIRGFANRNPRPREMEIVSAWASRESLRIALS